MIELQLLNYVIRKQDISLLLNNNITPNRFSEAYMMEAMFVYNHYYKYNKTPDYPTMLAKFEDFEVIDVTESESYLISTFVEALKQRLQINAINEWAENLGGENSEEALKGINDHLSKINQLDIGQSVAVDITKDTSRYEQYVLATENPEQALIKTHIKLLDDIIGGILPNDLVVIAARTNQGKSFFSLKIGANMWDYGGKRILFYSGENSVLNTGYRFDTLNSHFSNKSLMYGDKDLHNGKTMGQYENYITELKKRDVPFYVVTPKEMHGNRLTVTKLKSLVDRYKPDVIFLDQLSLMSDDRLKGNQQERLRYSHIMEDLRLFTESKEIPIFIMSQTSRNNSKNDDGVLEPALLEHLSESDGVGHNATKVITFAVNKGVLNVIVRKNTNGEKERGFKMVWDYDKGTFESYEDPDVEDIPVGDAPPEGNEIVF